MNRQQRIIAARKRQRYREAEEMVQLQVELTYPGGGPNRKDSMTVAKSKIMRSLGKIRRSISTDIKRRRM